MNKYQMKSSVLNSKARLVALAAAAFLAGCSMIPTYERPAAPVAATFPSGATVAGTAAAVDVPWKQFFTDVRLQQLIELSLANNRDLRVAVLNIEQARAQFQIRRADQIPNLNGVFSGSRNTQGAGQNAYAVGVQVTSFELDFFGRVASLKEQALAQYLSVDENRKTVQISLIASVANAWLNLLADEELLDITRQTLGTRDESMRLTKLRFDNGASSELDYRLAESLAQSARATLAQTQRQRALDENALTLLVGQPLPVALVPNGIKLADAAPMTDVQAGLPSDLLINRPDIRAAEQTLVAANANIGAARAAFFPKIALTVGAGSASGELSGLFKGGSWGYILAPSVTLPIFDAGRNQANLDSARAGQGIAVAQYEKSIQTAFREVADALAARETLGDQLTALQAQVNAESTRFKLSDLRYRNGIASYLDMLDAQRSLFTAQQSVVQTRLAQLQSQVTLYRTLGGGWDNSIPTASGPAALPATTAVAR